MSWLLWRQHRQQLARAVVMLLAFSVAAALTGAHLSDALSACRSHQDCGDLDILSGYSPMRAIVNLTIAVPLLIGTFWGATVVGKDLDAGTATLVWTQSVTRRRWLWVKLAVFFAATTLVSAAVTALVTWWSDAGNATVQSRFDKPQFDIQGIVPIGYALFAAALGLAASVLWRRVLPAVATTVGGFIGLRLLVEEFARSHYMSPVITTGSLDAPASIPSGSMLVSKDMTLHGAVVPPPQLSPADCPGASIREQISACLDHLGYRLRATYQPASRYWTFQWIEFGIFTALAILLVAVAVVTLRRHDA